MAVIGRNVIVGAVPDFPSRSVRLEWADGSVTTAGLGHVVGQGVFAGLADRRLFEQVSVGPRGRSLEWPGEIDLCADALWLEAHPEENPYAGHPSAAE